MIHLSTKKPAVYQLYFNFGTLKQLYIMNKNLLILGFLTMFLTDISAQSYWKKTDESKISLRNDDERTVIPEKYAVFNLDVTAIKHYLQSCPLEFTTSKGLTLDIPMPDGQLEKFEVFESPVMQSEIAKKYASIKTYKAYSLKDKTKNMRFSLADNGFYAAINAIDGEKYIDPYSEKNTNDYVVYNVKDHKSDIYSKIPMCGVSGEVRPAADHFKPTSARAAEIVELRVFKLAMACTGEWGKVARRGTVEKCMADINTMVNRMNSIYENEMAMRFVIIDNNDKLIFLDPNTDPYNNSDQGKVILGTNTSVIAQQGITSTSYDVGHVLSICFDIGGVAQGGSACQSNKGNGVTCNNDNDLTNIVTRVMAHEVGHQFDASHTWNICQPNDANVDQQRASNFAYEPGSGSTIMSYAGSCSSDNVSPDNDDYFHVASLEQMYKKTYSGGNASSCSDKIPTTNHFPAIKVPSESYTLPISTPFVLEGSATDEDGDALTYCWEQFDLGPKVALGTNGAEGPLFRSFKPSNVGYRFFPKAGNILAGTTTDKTEVLPNVSREMNFRLTVRDNNAQVGGVLWEDYSLDFTETAGPFVITYPSSAEKFKIGDQVNVTWDVANTNVAPVNCKAVNIYGSYASALHQSDPNLVPLALNVPNDGSQAVYIPNKTSNLFRIVIKAADNIFLTTHKSLAKVEAPTGPAIYVETQQNHLKICQPDAAEVSFTTAGLTGYTGDIKFELVEPLPAGLTGAFENDKVVAGSTNKFTLNTTDVSGNLVGEFQIRTFAEGIDTIIRVISYDITGGNLNGLSTLLPLADASNVASNTKFEWSKIKDAIAYEWQLAISPDFAGANLVTQLQLTDTLVNSSIILEKSTIYYWRVRALNSCRAGSWSKISAFSTEALSCKEYSSGTQSVVLSSAGTPTGELTVNIPDQGTISDLNVKLIKADHARVGDLVVYLVAPSSKEALLWKQQCSSQANINVGLDDQAPQFFQCPINTGKVLRTHIANGGQKLDIFNGEQLSGTWKLRVEDKVSGSGGKLIELNLEICSNISVMQPFIVKNETLKLAPKDKQFITDAYLLSSDNNNTAAELQYTLVDIPVNGVLTFNGSVIGTGAKFSQADINASKLRYESNLADNGTDAFSFTVSDGQGGWIGITNFNVVIDKTIDVAEVALAQDVFVFPNPTEADIQVVLSGNALSLTTYHLTDISGREIVRGRVENGKVTIFTTGLAHGVYFIKLTDGKHNVSKKIVKI